MNLQRVELLKATLYTVGMCLLLTGCNSAGSGSNYPDPVPVEGVVMLDGKPLENAWVNFVPVGANMLTASATTDESGSFVLETGSGPAAKPGAIPGKYKVCISSLVTPDGSRVVFDPSKPPAMQLALESLPSRYSVASDTLLEATIKPAGDEELKFELTTQ